MPFTSRDVSAEARFAASFQNAFVGIAHVGLNGEWLRVNNTLCEMVGYTAEELEALTFQDITHPDDLDADLALLEQLVKDEIANYRMEKRYIRKDGSIVWIDLQVAPQRDADGELVYFISTILDISRRTKLESQLRESAADVERLLHVIVHELRNPLGNILMHSELLQQLNENDKLDASIAAVMRDVSTTVDILEHLETLGKAAPEATSFELKSAVAQAVDSLGYRLSESASTVDVSGSFPAYVRGHKAAAVHVIRNLVDNAIKYGRDDRLCEVAISCDTQGDEVRLAIADNGRGIPVEDQRRVFEAAQRGSNSRDRPGRGLGLSLCMRLMDVMQGSIRLARSGKDGTVMLLTFKAGEPDQDGEGNDSGPARSLKDRSNLLASTVSGSPLN